MYVTTYETGLIGTLTLESDGERLTGCRFANAAAPAEGALRADDLPVFAQARAWLDRYFAGRRPDPRELPLGPAATPFQACVREAMLDIPYGQTVTYGAIAQRLETETGRRQSAQAVGQAVGRNPLGVIVPCHRVMGAGGNLTGFGGGLDTKEALLRHEQADMAGFFRPRG